MNADTIFSELRALLEKQPTPNLRETLYAAINDFATGASKDELTQFQTQYLPHIQEQLDTKWPVELRWSCVFDHGPGELMCSKLLAVTDYGATPTQLSKALRKFSRKLTKDYEGFWIRTKSTPLKEFVVPLCKKIDTITHVEIENEDSVSDILDWLAAHHGASVRHLTLRSSCEDLASGYDGNVDPYIGELIPRLDHFPALRSLGFNHTIAAYGHAHSYLEELMAHPIATQIESLDLCANPRVFKDAWLTDTDVWSSLQRLRVLGLPNARAVELMNSPSLQGLKVWNLAPNGWGRKRDWSEPEIDLWTAKATHTDPGEALRKAKVDILLTDDKDLRDMFLDEQGMLKPSSKLEELYCNWLTEEVFEAILKHGHTAYPNLKSLTCRGVGTYISPAMYARVNESPLFERLDTFDWYVLKLSSEYHGSLSEETRAEAYTTWHMLAMDAHYHLTLRQRAWDTLLSCTKELKHYKMLARIVGVKGRSKLKKDGLKQAIEVMRPSA